MARRPSTSFWKRILSQRVHPADAMAGLAGAVVGVPDGMASSVVIGVSPVHGLYANIFGPLIGGLTSRSGLLVISTTSAASLAATEVIKNESGDERVAALLLVTFLAGVFQAAATSLGLARLTSFVSYSVMTGFLMGIAVRIILGQMGNLFGYQPVGANAILKTTDLVANLSSADLATTLSGLLTIALLLLAHRAHLKALGPLLALVVPTMIVALGSVSSVVTVKDVNEIPSGLPSIAWPNLSLLSEPLVTGSLAVGAIIFVQTAGVSQGLPGPARPANQKGDLRAAGLANIGTALFQGQPVGGSFGQSALNVQAGARSRLATILSGIWVLPILLFFGGLVEMIPMSSLAAIIIVAAIGALRVGEATSIWKTGWSSRTTVLATFCMTLFLPIQLAVAAGVGLSAALYLASAAADVQVKELTELPDGRVKETEAPRRLQTKSVVVLQVYGSLFYAGARTLATKLPVAGDARRVVVILRLRGTTNLGDTAIEVLSNYAQDLRLHDGRLWLAGLGPPVLAQLDRNGKLKLAEVRLYPASAIVGESTRRSQRDAWIVDSEPPPTSDDQG